MLVPTLAVLNVDVVAPSIVTSSEPRMPVSAAVPARVAVVLASYSLLFPVTPVIVKPLAVMFAVNPDG